MCECVCVLVAESHSTLWDPMECSPSGPSVHGILQARILQWVAMSSSRGSSQPRDWIRVSSTASRFFTIWATWEAHSDEWMASITLEDFPYFDGLILFRGLPWPKKCLPIYQKARCWRPVGSIKIRFHLSFYGSFNLWEQEWGSLPISPCLWVVWENFPWCNLLAFLQLSQ